MIIRSRRLWITVLVVCLMASAVIAGFTYSFLSPNSTRNRASAMECTLNWGRLAVLPATTSNLTISTEGSMLSRAFRVSFLASTEDIERWLADSPGTHAITPTVPARGVRHFDIAPGGGAAHAEVDVDDTSHRVSIYVYWS